MKKINFSGSDPVHSVLKYFLMLLSAVILSGSAKIDERAVPEKFLFDFGNGKVASGYTQVRADAIFSKEAGYGFEPGASVQDIDRGGDALTGDFVTSESFFRFSVALPEGNYKVTVYLGSESSALVRLAGCYSQPCRVGADFKGIQVSAPVGESYVAD